MSWIDCVVDNDYEIYTEYPFTIRKKSNGHEVGEYIDKDGYVRCNLNQKPYLKHRIIALQFIQNDDPENKTDIDHINHDKIDYHLENLRWCSRSENNKNRTSYKSVEYEFVDEISDDAIMVIDYGAHRFQYLYYVEEDDSFYEDIGVSYRKLHTTFDKRGRAFVNAYNTNDKRVQIYFNKFKRIYNLI